MEVVKCDVLFDARRRVTGDPSLGQPQLTGVEQVLSETITEFDGDVTEGAVAGPPVILIMRAIHAF